MTRASELRWAMACAILAYLFLLLACILLPMGHVAEVVACAIFAAAYAVLAYRSIKRSRSL